MMVMMMMMMMMLIMMMTPNNDDDTAEYVIPETDEGLKERFNHLFIEFTRTKEHGPELNVLLGEMLKPWISNTRRI